MKNISKRLSVILAFTLAATALLAGASAASAADLQITAYDQISESWVDGCSKSAEGVADVPAVYNGYPVTRIAAGAFKNCSGVTRINIPSSVNTVGSNAFESCLSLESVYFARGECNLGSAAFLNCDALKTVVLPSKLKKINSGTFDGCRSLAEIDIPAETESIGEEAFKLCESLNTIFIPASVNDIGKNAFVGCASATSFEVDPANTAYKSVEGCLYGLSGTGADPGKTLIKYPAAKNSSLLNVEAGTLSVAPNACESSAILAKVVLPGGLETIGEFAFFCCDKLSDINIPDSATFIGTRAFAKCPSLKSVTIPGSVSRFESCFTDSGLKKVVIEEGVETIGTRCFENCAELTDVKLPESLKTVGIGAFLNCSSLETLTVPANVKTFGNKAFEGCASLTLIVDEGSAAYDYAVANGIGYRLKTPPEKLVERIEINTPPDKTKYFYRENLDAKGLSITAIYNDGSREILDSGFDCSPSFLKFTGTRNITVTYEGAETSFPVTVSYAWWQWIIKILFMLLGLQY